MHLDKKDRTNSRMYTIRNKQTSTETKKKYGVHWTSGQRLKLAGQWTPSQLFYQGRGNQIFHVTKNQNIEFIYLCSKLVIWRKKPPFVHIVTNLVLILTLFLTFAKRLKMQKHLSLSQFIRFFKKTLLTHFFITELVVLEK